MADPTYGITHKRVLSIALPIVISNATVPILGAVDTGVIGQLAEQRPSARWALAPLFWVRFIGFLDFCAWAPWV